jgi:predicted MFS family arabinose efflux permease
MQQDAGLSLAQGSWLATANYAGYLVGAGVCMVVPIKPARAIQWGLLSTAVFTLGMGLTNSFWLWFALRFLAGAASAFVLVGVSAWAMPILARRREPRWPGRVFSGVGIGICLSGLISLAAGTAALGSRATWLLFGLIAAAFAMILWRQLAKDNEQAVVELEPGSGRLSRHAWLCVVCYGVFGYGYIIPATYLPALARDVITNPAVFGWVWPVFGAAAAVSTAFAAQCLPKLSPRRLWISGQLVLAVGVIVPVYAANLIALMIAALCVGGTFVVITMAGIQEARRLGGAHAARLIAMKTTAFALGQMAGPLTVGLFHTSGLLIPSLVAAFGLVASSFALGLSARASGDV